MDKRKSIKRSVWIRTAAALASVLLFSFVTTANILRIQGVQNTNTRAASLLQRAQGAETAHYRWASNLSNALYAGAEFTGSIDPTTCALGQWLYGDAETGDAEILALRSQMEPLHKEIHESATHVLELLKTSQYALRLKYSLRIVEPSPLTVRPLGYAFWVSSALKVNWSRFSTVAGSSKPFAITPESSEPTSTFSTVSEAA